MSGWVINFEVFIEVIDVWIHAIKVPRSISKSGMVFSVIWRDELNAIKLGVSHINVLPMIIALEDNVITAVLMFRGSSWYRNGRLIWLLTIATKVARIE